jgi:hypothetical protein
MSSSLRSFATAVLASVALIPLSAFAVTTNTLLPISDGYTTQWTSTSTSHYVLVDDAVCNGTGDYINTTTTGQRESYGITDSVTAGATITQIEINPCASRDNSNAGANSFIDVFFRFGGINSSDSAGISLSGTTPIELGTTTFSNLSLLKTSTTTLEIGALFASGAKGHDCHELQR